jgi:hypothetical protein
MKIKKRVNGWLVNGRKHGLWTDTFFLMNYYRMDLPNGRATCYDESIFQAKIGINHGHSRSFCPKNGYIETDNFGRMVGIGYSKK